MIPEEKWPQSYQLANQAFDEGSFHDAIKQASKLAFSMLQNQVDEKQLIQTLNLVIEAFKKIDPENLLENEENGNRTTTDQLINQYFHVIRHYLDHLEIFDENQITKEINREIPLGVSQKHEQIHQEENIEQVHPDIPPYNVSITTSQGPRNYMEDTYLVEKKELDFSPFKTITFFGVFDGHGGASCALYVQSKIVKIILQEIKNLKSYTDSDLYHAISRAFVNMHDLWGTLPFQEKALMPDFSGTTATVALLIDNQMLWVANVGDSRAVLGVNGKAVQLSEEAKPTVVKYYDEILFRGGNVFWGRVDGSLDMARSIGDLQHPSVSPRPTLRKFDLSAIKHKKDVTLILATDGLWEVIDPQMAVTLAMKEPHDEAEINLVKLAYRRGSWDNIALLIVRDLSN